MNPTPTPYQFKSPHFKRLGYLFWGVFLIFSIVFYKERAIFMDGAFQLFELINDKTFKIYHYRLTNPLTQILALTAIYLKLPLKWVLIGYSVNFILFHLFIYHLLVKWLKNDYLAWTQIFFFSLIVLDSFYFLPPELYQGMSLLLLCFGIILKRPLLKERWVQASIIGLLILIIFDHKLLVLFFLFLWAFFWLSNQQLRHWKYGAFLGIAFLVFFLHGQFFTDWYDAAKQQDFWKHLGYYSGKYQAMPANKLFLTKCLKFFYFYPILLFTVMFYYLYQSIQQRSSTFLLKLLMVIIGNIGYLFIVHVGSPTTTYKFYSEVNYLPLTILTAVPFIFDIVSKIKLEKLVLIGFSLILIIRLNTIAQYHQKFENRQQWYLGKMEEADSKGFNRSILSEKDQPQDIFIMSWPSPEESLLISALEGPNASKSVLISFKPEKYKEDLNEEDIFLTSFKKIPIEDLNQDYFKFSNSRYFFKD